MSQGHGCYSRQCSFNVLNGPGPGHTQNWCLKGLHSQKSIDIDWPTTEAQAIITHAHSSFKTILSHTSFPVWGEQHHVWGEQHHPIATASTSHHHCLLSGPLDCTNVLASFPGSPPPHYFVRTILFTQNYCSWQGRGRAWEALITCGYWWHVLCPLCPRMRVQKSEKAARIRLFGVLYRWLNRWTRLPCSQHFDASCSWISDSADDAFSVHCVHVWESKRTRKKPRSAC